MLAVMYLPVLILQEASRTQCEHFMLFMIVIRPYLPLLVSFATWRHKVVAFASSMLGFADTECAEVNTLEGVRQGCSTKRMIDVGVSRLCEVPVNVAIIHAVVLHLADTRSLN